jgi:hypothetical protein
MRVMQLPEIISNLLVRIAPRLLAETVAAFVGRRFLRNPSPSFWSDMMQPQLG